MTEQQIKRLAEKKYPFRLWLSNYAMEQVVLKQIGYLEGFKDCLIMLNSEQNDEVSDTTGDGKPISPNKNKGE